MGYMYTPTPLYYLAILPGPPVAGQLQQIRLQLGNRFSLKRALRSPPHITLIPPFRLDDTSMPDLVYRICKVCSTQQDFIVYLHGMSFFSNRVLFANPVSTEPLLRLQSALQSALALPGDTSGRPYLPHLTLLLNDRGHTLPPGQVKEAIQNIEIHCTFQIRSVYLLRLSQKRWQACLAFHLSPSKDIAHDEQDQQFFAI